MDKSRQQFEETIKQLSDPSEFESKLKHANNGLNYADCNVDLMWISWQASRESYLSEQQELTCVLGDNKKLAELLDEYINQQRSENKKW